MSSSNHYHAFRAREAEILKQWPALAKYVDLLPKQPPLEGSDAARYVADLLSSWPNLASLREPLFTERKEQLLRVRQYAREVGCVETPEEQQWFNRIAGDSAAAVDPTALPPMVAFLQKHQAELVAQWPQLTDYLAALPKTAPAKDSDAARYVQDVCRFWPILAETGNLVVASVVDVLPRMNAYLKGCSSYRCLREVEAEVLTHWPAMATYWASLPKEEPAKGTADERYANDLHRCYPFLAGDATMPPELQPAAERVEAAVAYRHLRQVEKEAIAARPILAKYWAALPNEMPGDNTAAARYAIQLRDCYYVLALDPKAIPALLQDTVKSVNAFADSAPANWSEDIYCTSAPANAHGMIPVNGVRGTLPSKVVGCGMPRTTRPGIDAAAFREAQREAVIKPGGLLDRILAEAQKQMADGWPRAAIPQTHLGTSFGEPVRRLYMWTVVEEELKKRGYNRICVAHEMHHWGCQKGTADTTAKCSTPAVCANMLVFEW